MATGKKSRLAEIYRSEKKKGGGVGSTLGKAAAEKLDPRQIFNQQGFFAAAFPALFKAYKAAPGSGKMQADKIKKMSNVVSGDYGAFTRELSALTSQMHDVAVNSTIIAKNTMVLPAMAKDTNLMRQDIAKLVKLQGGTSTKKADMFFKSSKERESAYESKFKKEKKEQNKTPTAGAVQGATNAPTALQQIITTLADSLAKGVGIAALGVGIGGFFAGLALGGSVVSAIGGTTGARDMMINLAEGLKAFDGDSFLKFSALLAGGALFGAATGLKSKGGAMLGMGAVGAGIGLFFSGLAVGGALGDMIGNSEGIKEMMVNFAEGLQAFDPDSLSQFNTLLAAGGIFGAVAGVTGGTGAAVAAGATIGMGLIGTGIGLFLSGIAVGDKLIELITGGEPGSGIKTLLVNISDGLKSFSGIDTNAMLSISGVLPLLGASMLAYFGTKGVAGVVNAIGDGMSKFMNFIFGNENKSPMQKLSEDLQKFNAVNGDNLSKIGQGFKDLVSGMETLSKTTPPAGMTPSAAPSAPLPPLPSKPGPYAEGKLQSQATKPSAAPTPAPATREDNIKNYIAFGDNSGSETSFNQLNPQLKGAVIAAAMDYNSKTGKKFLINSAVRSDADQQRLWDETVAAGRPGISKTGMTVARPGQSKHIKGLAIDIQQGKSDPDAIAALNRQGLYQTVKNDPVHFELTKNKQPSMDQANPSSGSLIASTSSDLSSGQRNLSAPNITVIAPSKGTQQVASATSQGPIAPPIDRELARQNKWLTRQTSLAS